MHTQPHLKNTLYGRRKGRPLRPTKQHLMTELLPTLLLDLDEDGHVPASILEKKPVWLEIGYGTGDHLAAQMHANLGVTFIGCEPFVNGMADLLSKLTRQGTPTDQLHLYSKDGQSLLKGLPAGTIKKIFLLFPDPWPKKRHLKRRFFSETTLIEMLRVLDPEGEIILASDHADYFQVMEKILSQNQTIQITEADVLNNTEDMNERPPNWPMTRFEKKAHRAGRTCRFVRFRKIL